MNHFTLSYYGVLEQSMGAKVRSLATEATNPKDLWIALRAERSLPISVEGIAVAVNDRLVPWSHRLADGDAVDFLPPICGG